MFHCGQCGTKFKSVSFPKECRECSHIQYSNPNPVAVALIPVWKSDTTATLGVRLGIILGKRGIYPMLGEWALPGGYVENDLKETAEMAECEKFEKKSDFRWMSPKCKLHTQTCRVAVVCWCFVIIN